MAPGRRAPTYVGTTVGRRCSVCCAAYHCDVGGYAVGCFRLHRLRDGDFVRVQEQGNDGGADGAAGFGAKRLGSASDAVPHRGAVCTATSAWHDFCWVGQ
eukprot:4210681-Prymnesium_polylepis.1